MAVQTDFTDEARRFVSIQLSRYLEERPGRDFTGPAERDAVMEIIRDAWVELRSGSALTELSRDGRDAVYWTTLIIFPTFVADAGLSCIPVDFMTGRRIGDRIIAAPIRPTLDYS